MTDLLDPRLADCRRIFLQGMSLQASIGFHPFEKTTRQRIRIGVEIFVPVNASTSERDDVSDVLDYDFIRTGISALAASRHFNLQETLADEIVALCLKAPMVRAVRVRTEKPDVYPDCETIGTEVMAWATTKPS